MNKAFLQSSGYSLIELLVSIAIMAIIFSVGIANYRSFARRQVLTNNVKSVQGDLRLAQQAALSGQMPADPQCNGATNELKGFNFQIIDSTHYEIRANCTGGNATDALKSKVLDSGITFASPFPAPNPILFKVLGSGTNLSSGSITLTLSQASTGLSTQISISKNGNIQ